MNELGVLHILITIVAYVLYIFLFVKSISGKISYKLLNIANILYVLGFVLGMVWANLEWGYMLSLDLKIILSILVPIPFIYGWKVKKGGWKLLGFGCLLIILNYLLPLIIGTIHTHLSS